MKEDLTTLIAKLRVAVGYLGEKSQHNWWGSNFLGASSAGFLIHPYPRTTFLAQYHGACEAALLVHDEYIGVGGSYHLYKLPDSLERDVVKVIQGTAFRNKLKMVLQSKAGALSLLQELSENTTEKIEGPINLGKFTDAALETTLQPIIGYYLQAFSHSYKCFPYMIKS